MPASFRPNKADRVDTQVLCGWHVLEPRDLVDDDASRSLDPVDEEVGAAASRFDKADAFFDRDIDVLLDSFAKAGPPRDGDIDTERLPIRQLSTEPDLPPELFRVGESKGRDEPHATRVDDGRHKGPVTQPHHAPTQERMPDAEELRYSGIEERVTHWTTIPACCVAYLRRYPAVPGIRACHVLDPAAPR